MKKHEYSQRQTDYAQSKDAVVVSTKAEIALLDTCAKQSSNVSVDFRTRFCPKSNCFLAFVRNRREKEHKTKAKRQANALCIHSAKEKTRKTVAPARGKSVNGNKKQRALTLLRARTDNI